LAEEEKEFHLCSVRHCTCISYRPCRMFTLNTGHLLLLISFTDILHSIFEANIPHLRIWSSFLTRPF
jgi:hypothetical protein